MNVYIIALKTPEVNKIKSSFDKKITDFLNGSGYNFYFRLHTYIFIQIYIYPSIKIKRKR